MNSGIIAVVVMILLALFLIWLAMVTAPDIKEEDGSMILPEDHEQAERDYYDRQYDEGFSYLLFYVKLMGTAMLIVAVYHLIRSLIDKIYDWI